MSYAHFDAFFTFQDPPTNPLTLLADTCKKIPDKVHHKGQTLAESLIERTFKLPDHIVNQYQKVIN